MLKAQMMSKPNQNDNLARDSYLAWLLISLVIVVILTLFLPFPISFLVSLIVIFSLNIIRTDIAYLVNDKSKFAST
jgi:hypothetical protein